MEEEGERASVVKISKSDIGHLQLLNQNLGLYSQMFIGILTICLLNNLLAGMGIYSLDFGVYEIWV